MKTTPGWQFAPETAPEAWPKTTMLARTGMALSIINIIILVAAPLSRIYLDITGITAFHIFYYSLQAGLVLAALGLIIIIIAAFKRITSVRKDGVIMLLLGLLPIMTVLMVLGPDKLGSPMIHDISTDTANPPEFIEAGKQRTTDENSLAYQGDAISTIQDEHYPDIKPLIVSISPEEALDEAIRTVKDLGWEFINVDFDKGIIEAYDTTTIFAFVDDVVIRVRREGSGSRVDIRSASRIGKGDLGKNAERIRKFIRAFRG